MRASPAQMEVLLDISKVGVVGCGLMGSGIAEISAKSGFTVVVREVDDESLEAGRARITRSMDRAVETEKQTAEERDAAWEKLAFTTDVAEMAKCDIVIEAIVEELDAKRALFGALDELCGERTVSCPIRPCWTWSLRRTRR